MFCQASAPATTFVAGEHAVVYGTAAIVAPLNLAIKVQGKFATALSLQVYSSQFGSIATNWSNLNYETTPSWCHFILASLEVLAWDKTQGLSLNIVSEVRADLGFGTSSASLIALLRVLLELAKTPHTDSSLLKLALTVQQRLGKQGSGADLACAIVQKPLLYQQQQVLAQLNQLPPFSLVYVGYKTPTTVVVAALAQRYAKQPDVYEATFASIHAVTKLIYAALEECPQQLRALFAKHHQLQCQLDVVDEPLATLLDSVLSLPGCLGAKISGSGLGDCVIVLGQILYPREFPYQVVYKSWIS